MSAGLARFVAVSAALHLALLAIGPWSARAPAIGAPPGGPALVVRLGAHAAAPAPAHTGPAARAARTEHRATVRPAHARRAQPASRTRRTAPRARHRALVANAARRHPPRPAPTQSDAPRAAAARPGGGDAAAAQFLRAALLRLLGAHFDYPWIARRRGWEGEVRLAMRVGAAGRVSDLRVVGTSGYRVLDRAALRSARHIRTVPDAARWLHGRSVDIVVPVEYRLVNG